MCIPEKACVIRCDLFVGVCGERGAGKLGSDPRKSLGGERNMTWTVELQGGTP